MNPLLQPFPENKQSSSFSPYNSPLVYQVKPQNSIKAKHTVNFKTPALPLKDSFYFHGPRWMKVVYFYPPPPPLDPDAL